jgi:nucleotide-binding universal stress UspA family protein
MYRTILVPLNGEPRAERALPLAEALARRTGARLVLLRGPLERERERIDPESRVTATAEAQAYLDTLVGQLAARGDVADAVTPYAEPATAILEETRLRHVGLIVMTTHGRGGPDRWAHGSVAAAVLAAAPVPVLLTRDWRPQHPGAPFGERPAILVPLDGSAFGEAVLPLARDLAEVLGGELVLARVATPPPPRPLELGFPDIGAEVAVAKGEAVDYLARLAEHVTPGVPIRRIVRIAAIGSVADTLLAIGRESGAACIAMATHGRTGTRRALLGSVADRLLREGEIPLMLVRPTSAQVAP